MKKIKVGGEKIGGLGNKRRYENFKGEVWPRKTVLKRQGRCGIGGSVPRGGRESKKKLRGICGHKFEEKVALEKTGRGRGPSEMGVKGKPKNRKKWALGFGKLKVQGAGLQKRGGGRKSKSIKKP